jgi:hypothetical protein
MFVVMYLFAFSLKRVQQLPSQHQQGIGMQNGSGKQKQHGRQGLELPRST